MSYFSPVSTAPEIRRNGRFFLLTELFFTDITASVYRRNLLRMRHPHALYSSSLLLRYDA